MHALRFFILFQLNRNKERKEKEQKEEIPEPKDEEIMKRESGARFNDRQTRHDFVCFY